MSRVLYTITAILFIACNSTDKAEEKKENTPSSETKALPASLEPFADSLVRLDKYSSANIDKAGYYYGKLVPADSTLADSAAVMLLHFSWAALDSVNQRLWADTTDYMDLVYSGGNPPTEKQKAFQQALKKDHINLRGNGEGDVVAVLDYEWFNGVIQPKTSSATDAYLLLLSAETSEPALQDAALAIEIKELISRCMLSENLMKQNLPASFAENLKQNYKFYVDVLCLGSDNTPSLDDEQKMTLTPEFKEGYDYLLATYPTSETALKINEWLAVIKAKDRKKLGKMRKAMYE